MTGLGTLKLVTDAPDTTGTPRDAARDIFDHWVFMLGKRPKQVAFGPKRRRVVEQALDLYDADMLRAAIEGCASHPHNRGDNERGEEYTDIELILRNESQIERFARRGFKLRASVERAMQREREPAAVEAPADPAAVEAGRQRLRDLAAQLGRARHG